MFTLSGPTEVGKTHLNDKIWNFLFSVRKNLTVSPQTVNGDFGTKVRRTTVKAYTFQGYVDACLSDPKEKGRFYDYSILSIEEFLSGNFDRQTTYSEMAIEFAFNLLNERKGKTTILDTNKSRKEIEAIDERIASRLFRDNGMFITIPKDMPKYLTRKK